MSVTDKLEKIMERLMSKIGEAFSGGKVHPLEIAKKTLQELKRNQKVSISNTYIPNVYEVYLCKEDLQELLPYKEAIIPEIKEYLIEYIKKEELSLIGPLEIEFMEKNDSEKEKFTVKSLVKKGEKTEDLQEKTLVRKSLLQGINLYATDGPAKGTVFSLKNGKNIMGRKEENEVAISDPEISRKHSLIDIISGEGWIEDLESTNGTFINGEMVKTRTPLKSGDIISLGDNILEFIIENGK